MKNRCVASVFTALSASVSIALSVALPTSVSTALVALILCGGGVVRMFAGGGGLSAEESGARPVSPVQIYATRFEPSEHPDYHRYTVTPPGWKTFDNQTQFIALRSFPSHGDRGFDFARAADQFTDARLGRVMWPHATTIFFENLDELADVILQRDLFLFDLWGYVPGSGPRNSGDWTQFRADPASFRLLEERLGERWLGMDNGEQDGRYIGGYAPSNHPISSDRFEQYLRFQSHFERLGDDLGNRLATLVSLNFGHYFLKEGIYTLLGAETAQALPNSQVYYAWIRGACKQYGVLWFGNASIFNRWGWKVYPNEDPGGQFGPTKGTSLSLLKRLLYSHVLYNSAAVGFENGWFIGDELGPIGRIQQGCADWLETHGDPGVMMTPVALLADFYSGWSFPRHLYTSNTYRVWGNIPYASGDYLANNLLEMIYPGYQDSSYFHDETGFLTATPFSDGTDVLLSDAPTWCLTRYPRLVVADALRPDTELRDKLAAYVAQGGRLVMTGGNLDYFGVPFGVKVSDPREVDAGLPVCTADGREFTESVRWEFLPLQLPDTAHILATCDAQAVVAEIPFGKGSVILFASPFGLPQQRVVAGKIANPTDKPLVNPLSMLDHVRHFLAQELDQSVLFEVGAGLGSIVCRKEGGGYTVGVFNNTLSPLPFQIVSRIGPIESIRELSVDTSERHAVGFMPEGFETAALGEHSEREMAGGDVRIFEVRLTTDQTVEIPHETPAPRPTNRWLTLRGNAPLKEQLLARPTFFQHFDGVLLDWRYFQTRSVEELRREAGWIVRQQVCVAVDFSSGINLYPDLRLIKNDTAEYEQSRKTLDEVIAKASLFGVKTVVMTTHRFPENNYTDEQSRADFIETLREIAQTADSAGITLSLRLENNRPYCDTLRIVDLLDAIGAPNITLAPSLHILARDQTNTELWDRAKNRIGSVFVAAALHDENNGKIWSLHGRLAEVAPDQRRFETLQAVPGSVMIFDAVFNSPEEEYLEVHLFEHEGVLRTR